MFFTFRASVKSERPEKFWTSRKIFHIQYFSQPLIFPDSLCFGTLLYGFVIILGKYNPSLHNRENFALRALRPSHPQQKTTQFNSFLLNFHPKDDLGGFFWPFSQNEKTLLRSVCGFTAGSRCTNSAVGSRPGAYRTLWSQPRSVPQCDCNSKIPWTALIPYSFGGI